MSKCVNCGAELKEEMKFCTECGTPVTTVSAAPSPDTEAAAAGTQAAPVYGQAVTLQTDMPPAPGSKYELMSTWGIIGMSLLMCIPIVGFVLMIIWAFGGCRKLQKRNFARAYLIFAVISLVISLIVGMMVRSAVKKVEQQIHAVTGQVSDGLGLEDIADVLTGVEDTLAGKPESSFGSGYGSSHSGGGSESNSDSSSASSSAQNNLSDIEGLGALGVLAGLMGGEEAEGLEALMALAALSGSEELTEEQLAAFAALAEAENSQTADEHGDGMSFNELVNEVEQINAEAAAKADGWPSSLPDYPDGTMKSVETYRTEISGTSKETMLAYIETLKKKGFAFQDFYGLGMSESDMLGMNAWWATDGKLYLSISYYEGTVTIDHMNELPDLSSLMGG